MNFASSASNFASEADGTVADLFDLLGRPGVLLAVWAHPDDESFLGAGLMAEVARRGGRVVNVTATVGEHGIAETDQQPSALGTTRSDELETALSAIGAEPAKVLGFSDGACEHVPDALGARHVASVIDDVRPNVILGFGPDGVTGHPDHRAVARWTARAVEQTGNRLPFVTTAAGQAWPEPCVERLHQIDAFWPGYPQRAVAGSPVAVGLNADLLDRKLAALSAHDSQIGPVQDVLGPDLYRRLASTEAYRGANAAASRLLIPGSVLATA